MEAIKRTKSPFEQKMYYFGLPLALIIFAFIFTMPTPGGLTYSGKMALGVFLFALVLWVSQSLPNYVTSLLAIVLLALTGGWTEKAALGVFGYKVIWLMVAAFIITAGMEKSGLAKRLALWLISKFGKTSKQILASMMIVNFLIAFIVPSTTARAAMMFPILVLVAHTYGIDKENGDKNLGKLLAIQGLQANNLSTSAILTATAPQILAIGFIKEFSGVDISWSKWFIAAAPIAVLSLAASYFVGLAIYKPKNLMAGEGINKLKEEYNKLDKMSGTEKKALVIFLITILLWSLDRWHTKLFGFQMSLVAVAIIAAILFFMPYCGILTWKETKIPWNLMIFSCGAYAAGTALNDSGVASWALSSIFDGLGVENMSFITLYAVVIFISSFSHLAFTSKTVRTIIVIPTVLTLAQVANVNPVALALPAAFTIADTITLPPHCKPNLIYYSTGYFTVLDQLKYGVIVLLIKWALLIIASLTWFKFIGIV